MATAVELCILFLVIMIKNDLRWRWIYFFLTIEFPIYLNTGILQLILFNSLQFLTTVHLYLNDVGGRVCVCVWGWGWWGYTLLKQCALANIVRYWFFGVSLTLFAGKGLYRILNIEQLCIDLSI